MTSGKPRSEAGSATEATSSKQPYESPAISWTEETEIKANLASACDKVGGQGGQCDSNPGS
jgi:hypothetical protein